MEDQSGQLSEFTKFEILEPEFEFLMRMRTQNIQPKTPNLLKADRPHPRNYLHTATDHRHTDKHLRLVMVLIALYSTWQSRAPNIDRCTPEN